MTKLEELIYVLTAHMKEGESATITMVLTRKKGKIEPKRWNVANHE